VNLRSGRWRKGKKKGENSTGVIEKKPGQRGEKPKILSQVKKKTWRGGLTSQGELRPKRKGRGGTGNRGSGEDRGILEPWSNSNKALLELIFKGTKKKETVRKPHQDQSPKDPCVTGWWRKCGRWEVVNAVRHAKGASGESGVGPEGGEEAKIQKIVSSRNTQKNQEKKQESQGLDEKKKAQKTGETEGKRGGGQRGKRQAPQKMGRKKNTQKERGKQENERHQGKTPNFGVYTEKANTGYLLQTGGQKANELTSAKKNRKKRQAAPESGVG